MCCSTSLRNGLKVLVVDGHLDSGELLAVLFAQYGVEATIATCASEAIEIIHQAPPDLLISEILLPDEDGYSLINKVKEFESAYNVQIPAIALTVAAQESDQLRALAAGFCRHLTKPLINIDKLIATIACVIEQPKAMTAIAC